MLKQRTGKAIFGLQFCRTMLIIITLTCLLPINGYANALNYDKVSLFQEYEVRGKVVDETGMPVPADGNYDIIVNFNDFTYELIAL